MKYIHTFITNIQNFTPLTQSTVSRKSAVGVILYPDKNKLHLVLTERSHHLKNHAGEISFPGGTLEQTDLSLQTTCIREVSEELSIDLQSNHLLGRLDDVITGTGFLIRPYLFFLDHKPSIIVEEAEVESVLHISLNTLAERQKTQTLMYRKREWKSFTYMYDNHTIWGATASIISTLLNEYQN